MAERIALKLEPRFILGKRVKRLRREGITPVHLYGSGIEPRSLQCGTPNLLKALAEAGANTPVTLLVDGEKGEQLAFAREIQWNPLRGTVLHVDFLGAELTTRVIAEVPLVLTGSSEGARQAGGTLMQQLRTVQVEALPLEMPRELEVDVSQLTSPDRVLRVEDVLLPPGVTLVTDPSEPVARIEVAREEVVEEALPTEEEAAEVEESGAGEQAENQPAS